jgi:hypothetical protein
LSAISLRETFHQRVAEILLHSNYEETDLEKLMREVALHPAHQTDPGKLAREVLAGEAEVETAIPAALPAQETQSDTSAGTENGIVARDQSPDVQPDPVFRHMQSIGRAESWAGVPENHAGSFGPYPEEYE